MYKRKTKLSQNLRIFNGVVPDNEENLQVLEDIKSRLILLENDYIKLYQMVYGKCKDNMREKVNIISTQIKDVSALYNNEDNRTERILRCIEEFNAKGYGYLLSEARSQLNNL